MCTPVPVRRKRPLTQSQLPNKRPCPQGPARISTGLLRSPHQPPTPPAPKRRRPKTPPPPSPPAPVPRGLEETVAEDVARPLFVTRHGRANTLDTEPAKYRGSDSAEGRETTSQRGLSRPEPNEASSPTLHKDPPLKVQITHTHTHTHTHLQELVKDTRLATLSFSVRPPSGVSVL